MADILLPLYILSFISSLISVILALYAIRFSKRTEERLKRNFLKMRSMMDLQNAKTEKLLAGMGKEAEAIKSTVHETRLELLESIENVHKIREEILESVGKLEDPCIEKEIKKK